MGFNVAKFSPVAAVGTAVTGGLVERDWAKRDAERDRTFEREMVGRQEEFQTASAKTAHVRNQEYSKTAWERNMRASGSQYQRSMADMKKAGLNPMLAYMKGGAQVPGASTPSAASPSGSKGSARGTKQTSLGVSAGIGAGAQIMQAKTQMEVAKANIRQLDSITELNSAKAVQTNEQTIKIKAEAVGQLTENEIRHLKKLQSQYTGDSPVGRLINTMLRTGKSAWDALSKLMKKHQGKGRLKKTRPTLKTRPKSKTKFKKERFTYGKAKNKKAVRRKYTRKYGGPR